MDLLETLNRIAEQANKNELQTLSNSYNSFEYWDSQYKELIRRSKKQPNDGTDYKKKIKKAKKNRDKAEKNLAGIIQILNLKYPKKRSKKRH